MLTDTTYQQASAPEFQSHIRRTPDGTFTVAIRYLQGIRKGSSEVIPFQTEQAMQKFLNQETRDHVRYSTYRPLPGETFPPGSDMQSTKRQPTQPKQPIQPKRVQRQPELEPESELVQIGYSKEEADAIVYASYIAAASIRDWFVQCDANKEAVFLRLNDMQVGPTPGNIGQAMDFLYQSNNPVRKGPRRRGEPLPTTYISQVPTITRVQRNDVDARNMTTEQLKEIERQRRAKALAARNLPYDFVSRD